MYKADFLKFLKCNWFLPGRSECVCFIIKVTKFFQPTEFFHYEQTYRSNAAVFKILLTLVRNRKI